MELTEAVEVTVRALRDEGKVGPADELLIASVERLCVAVVAAPANAALWRELTKLVDRLQGLNERGGDDLAALMAELNSPFDADVGP